MLAKEPGRDGSWKVTETNDKIIYFSGSNLLTWAKWKQYDPETPVNGEVFCEAPAMRTFNFGVQLTF